jgi:hypothetical protein
VDSAEPPFCGALFVLAAAALAFDGATPAAGLSVKLSVFVTTCSVAIITNLSLDNGKLKAYNRGYSLITC